MLASDRHPNIYNVGGGGGGPPQDSGFKPPRSAILRVDVLDARCLTNHTLLIMCLQKKLKPVCVCVLIANGLLLEMESTGYNMLYRIPSPVFLLI